jgi:hypothetical protein
MVGVRSMTILLIGLAGASCAHGEGFKPISLVGKTITQIEEKLGKPVTAWKSEGTYIFKATEPFERVTVMLGKEDTVVSVQFSAAKDLPESQYASMLGIKLDASWNKSKPTADSIKWTKQERGRKVSMQLHTNSRAKKTEVLYSIDK